MALNYKRKRGNETWTQSKRRRTRTYTPEASALAAEKRMTIASRKTGRNELKIHYYTVPSQQVDYGGITFSLMDNMQQGTSPVGQYLGSQILPTSVRVNFDVTLLNGSDPTNHVRVLLFQWLDNGVPVPAGVWNLTSNVNAPFSFIRWENRENVKILRDELIPLMQQYPTGAYTASRQWYVKSKKLQPVRFAASYDDTVQKGDICMLVISDSSAADHPYFNCGTQLTYLDA